ncbi:MAG: trehalose-6-phosphate synthase [Myxococcales bacterium]
MNQALRFVAVLVVGLAACSALAHVALSRMTQRWFESDLEARAELVLTEVEPALVEALDHNDRVVLRRELVAMARKERLLGAQVCTENGVLLARTTGFPDGLNCVQFARLPDGAREPRSSGVRDLSDGPVFVTARVLPGNERTTVMVLQDMRTVGGRQQKAQQLVWLAFLVLSFAASIVTLVAMKLSWRSWTHSLRRLVQGKDLEASPEFRPLVGDVRELVQRMSSEFEQEARGGHWTPERLRGVLGQLLHGERIIVVSNREPYIHLRNKDGSIRWQHPASGLVTALEPVLRACSGVWVAHGAGSADRDTVDEKDHVKVPPGEEAFVLRRVWLTEEEEQGYYYGFANEGLWPLCHVAHTRPIFRAEDWEAYKAANKRFADAVVEEADTDDPIVLVQDYHFGLAPRMIRKRLPRATIITFWHIPWPNAEQLGICPFREDLLDGMLGSSILGFHTQQHCNNFFESVERYLEARIDREQNAVVRHARSTLIRPYPISIEWPVHWLEDLPSVEECRASVFQELGLASDALLGVGVDRLDYTKGIEERLLAVERVLERNPGLRGRFSFVQLGAPSRTRIPRYQALAESVNQVAERINARFGTESYKPIILWSEHHEPVQVFRFYRAADLCYVSSLHDGMNLVAKEFVAAREDEQGVLVLSNFTGASRELTEALVVNPYDLEEASRAIEVALQMPPSEQRQRMKAMRGLLSEFNIYRWAGRMLIDAAELRRRERLSDRLRQEWLPDHPARSPGHA